MATDQVIARDVRGLQSRDLILGHEDIARAFVSSVGAPLWNRSARHLQSAGDALPVEHPHRVPEKRRARSRTPPERRVAYSAAMAMGLAYLTQTFR
jgi:hypothetical protein